MRATLFLIFTALPVWCGTTTALFQPSSPEVGPFPSDAVAKAAPLQETGVQVNLPAPAGCAQTPTAASCVNTALLNQLDGFSVNPRITLCFSGPVNVASLAAGIRFLAVGHPEAPVGIDQMIFDPVGLCAYAKPSHVLEQDAQYVLVVASSVLDADGHKVKPSKDFSQCVKFPTSFYCVALSLAMHTAQAVGNPGNDLDDVVSASLFTTQSATHWLEQARNSVDSGSIPEVGSLGGPPATFNVSDLASVTWMPDPGADVSGTGLNQQLPLNDLAGVARISFGLFFSPLYLNTSGPQAGQISTTPTNLPIAPPSAVIPVSFHVFLPPASAVQGGKIPVIIYGHGLGDNQFGAPTYAASTWAQKGFATLAFEITGHGYGPNGVTQVITNPGMVPVNVPTPGRGIQFVPGNPIGPEDGCILPGALATRDCSRQSAVDLLALMQAIRSTNGLGLNLDPSRVYYTGQSFGAFYGALFGAVEPGMQALALNGLGGTQVDVARLSPIARALGAAYLAGFAPPLLNVPPASPEVYFHDSFNDEYVYRGQVITDNVPGALAVQAAFEQADWLGMIGDPLAYAEHLSSQPLGGMRAKQVLLQFSLGDLEVPNPAESAIVRAAGLEQQTWMLRTGIAAGIEPDLLGLMQPGVPYPIYPHRFLSNPTFFAPSSPPLETAIGVAAQSQIADFFSSGKIPDPNRYLTGPFAGLPLFQDAGPLPDMLNFLQIAP